MQNLLTDIRIGFRPVTPIITDTIFLMCRLSPGDSALRVMNRVDYASRQLTGSGGDMTKFSDTCGVPANERNRICSNAIGTAVVHVPQRDVRSVLVGCAPVFVVCRCWCLQSRMINNFVHDIRHGNVVVHICTHAVVRVLQTVGFRIDPLLCAGMGIPEVVGTESRFRWTARAGFAGGGLQECVQ